MANPMHDSENSRNPNNATLPGTNPSDPNNQNAKAAWYNNPFMKACRGEPTDVTPIWMMRQAGRYMSEYREVRAKTSFLELCANPQLCSEVMCTAVSRLGVDAAIIFSDLLPILVPMGMDLEFVAGDGPVIHNPLRTVADIDRVKPLHSNDELHFVMETVSQTRNDLPADMPLIGFAGAPFTLASYMIEGGSSRNYAHTKKLMYTDHGAWSQLMEHLSSSISIYLMGQIEAGAQVVQLFDSWAGCLSFEDYKQFVHPYVKQIIASLPAHVPVINFATGNPALLPLLAETNAAVIGIDWRLRLDEAWKTVGHERSVQGNLDPTVLLTNPAEIRKQAKTVLDQAAGRAGHIFNLGHGILPQTPVDNAIAWSMRCMN
jgi:uroporphyrinogen decarboxylase